MSNKIINLNDFRENKVKEQQQVTDEYLEPVKHKDKYDIAMSKEDIEMELRIEDWLMRN